MDGVDGAASISDLKKRVHQLMRTSLEDASIREILDRILDGCIAFDPLTRFRLTLTDFAGARVRVVLAPERRRKPFTIPRPSADSG